ncbi:hypothetical protein E1J38_013965 [Seonamhaeicola sediminis]|uniref:Uncharacterized protein n=1 Tax=Seonamhaeicola sediminis TaxID=2528206 RepID=A0A562YAR5_9FLAO|nr:hypothetical protein [Seonamhaeicola sediminis]TWO31372.1 hypothetical protein E1J38_013965 [Seonamhaeicola sediminis]
MKYSIIFFLVFVSFSFSQTKNEKEERIKAYEFPEIPLDYFNTISSNVKYLKFYRETDGTKKSFEAKFKYNKQHYSVEFDTIGNLEDIEIVIRKKDIPKTVLMNISKHFDDKFEKARFIKIQKQFINTTPKTDKQFLDYILKKPNNKHTHFEIIAEIKTKEHHQLRELTFDKDGTFEKSRIVTSASYEHALY